MAAVILLLRFFIFGSYFSRRLFPLPLKNRRLQKKNPENKNRTKNRRAFPPPS